MFQNQDVVLMPNTSQHSPINISPENPQQKQDSMKPYVVILEQPAPKALRFRYECEGRSAGSIPGANSTPDNKTYPTIQVKNYVGRAVVVVSCVTKDSPHKPHPHSLVGREGCRRGVCTLEINSEDMKIVFSNLGIQCVKKRDIEEALKIREEIRVDPYRTGYEHRNQPSSIDLNAVRLCFQVFLEGQQKGKFTTLVKPVVSEPIYDKKSMSDLVITKLSHCNALCNGGQEMILLCEKVAKEDIAIRFYEETIDGWEGYGEFQHSQVHKQVAISFRTPRFKAIDISEPVRVKVQLRRPSDGATSEPLDFEMLPLNEEVNEIRRKRQRSGDDAAIIAFKNSPAHDVQYAQRGFNVINDQPVKIEPRDQTTSPYLGFPGNYREPSLSTPSPQPQQISPPMFSQNSPSPLPLPLPLSLPLPLPLASPFNNNNVGQILQNQLQAPRVTTNNFQQQDSHGNQIYTPNIQTTVFPNGNNPIWNNNNINGNDPTLSRVFFNNNIPTTSIAPTSSIFNQPLTPLIPNTFTTSSETLGNVLIDLDNQLLNNLSGDLQSLSFSDFAMDSFSKTGEKVNKL